MQTPNLPIQPFAPAASAGASSNPSAPRPGANADGGGQFSAALSRQVEQRQLEQRQAKAHEARQQPAAAAKPAAAAPANPAQNRAEGAKAAAAEGEDKAAGVAGEERAQAKTEQAAQAEQAKQAEQAAQSAQAAQQADPAASAAAPVADMLALVANFHRMLAGGAAQDAGAAEAAPQDGAPPAMLALPRADGVAADAPAVHAGADGAGFALAAGKPAGAAGAGHEPAEAGAGALKAGAAQEKPQAEPFGPGGLRARDGAQDSAALKDGLAAAPASAPLQAAPALAQAQAVVGAGDKIAARVGTPGWDNQVGQKIVWMVAGKEQSASLTLNPPDLGPMQVVLSVTNDQASVTFSSAQPEVRQALENALPRLREMMSETGISLGNATVDAGAPDQRQAQGEARRPGSSGHPGGNAANGSAADAPPRPAASGQMRGLVDTFA